ncbi:glycosyltransferase involved in cell wall biosynthesis [Mycolicibacterium sp. BK556]|uniref:glycosyltransferase family 2 protein n=1 Tax=unclassified Mycolicibacterium TaxID=2636767 RepID=UPI00160C565B|nr:MULTISPECIES: glycosyltransferase family A protein [unclassified Mycolicibacterium]MBB3604897.1 glycosyltransferase involved in cell wall biosynthesis [Mycolicibacterium sp. BK556]MBB3635093.1 glycosyltransferase involved in cell wall biosynthesis [Mycolicibacterium sp. BK607]
MAEIGVVLPVFNGGSFLREALDSIASQTVQPCDVVAVDDGSTDDSQRLLRSFGARILNTDRLGQAAARDHGIAAVRGDVLAFLDQDDRWLPEKLERQTAYLAANSDVSFVGALCSVFLQPGTPRPAWWKTAWDNGVPEPSLLPSATLYRRSAFATAGGFAADAVVISEDMAWTAHAQDMGLRSGVVDEVLVERRVHARNASGDAELRAREHLAIIRSSLARKRLRHA